MRFAFWPGSSLGWTETLELARHIEATGWDGFYFADHFMAQGADTSGPWAEAWTTLAAIAASVPRVRIGTLVTGNTYRHPAVLAKMVATVDEISGGRVVLGLGAGWQENEHRAYGIPFYTMGERLARLEEACRVVKGLFSAETTDLDGKFYALAQAPLAPKPLQARLPLLIGGGGEKVTLRITARYADEWNVWGDVPTLTHKMAVLDRHCAELDRDPGEIQRSAVALLFLSDDESFLARVRNGPASARSIVGNVSEVTETLGRYREAGVDEIVVPDFTLGDRQRKRDTLDRFIEEIAPAFRAS